MEFVFAAALFFLIAILFELVYTLFRRTETRAINKVAERYSNGLHVEEEIDIFYYRRFSNIKLFNRLLTAIPVVGRLDELMQQGGIKILAGIFILVILLATFALVLICNSLHLIWPLTIIISSIGIVVPLLYLLYKRKKRREQFEVLFPDALDLMGYSLKAGHSILASFKMVAEEMADPVGEEFDRVTEEINFGRDIDSALRKLSHRIDSSELKFFVTSVIIQRETGGNLIEMFDKISQVIRRKFRFREKVKTLSAEGKLSATILLALPFLSASVIFTLNPEYIMVLVEDPIGPYAIAVAITMMSIGAFIMYRLVQLDL